jgi:hypothetical protein
LVTGIAPAAAGIRGASNREPYGGPGREAAGSAVDLSRRL